jgi:hypothetical protein
MELCFDDGMIEQDDHNGYENYTHECDFETSIDQIMVMNDISNKGNPRRNGPRLVRMDIATWNLLPMIKPHGTASPKKERVRSLITTSNVLPTIATVTQVSQQRQAVCQTT